MIATLPYIEKKYNEFNLLFFEGKLPIVPIKLSKSTKFLGKCVHRLCGRLDEYYLRFSVCFDLSEHELEDVIIHEMIHLYIAVNQIQDSSTHGKIFKTMMADINARYGRNISIKYTGTKVILYKNKWHVVAVVSFKDGKTGIKVLPRIIQRILTYYNAVNSNPTIGGIKLYMVNDPFFEIYPNSSALKVHFIDTQELAPHLKGAKQILCDGKKIL